MRIAVSALALTVATAIRLAPLGPPEPLVTFQNVADGSGVDFVLDNFATPNKHQIETMISGVAAFDFDNDGLLDLYFVNGARIPELDKSGPRFWNRLYRNKGGTRFEDVTERAGVKGIGYGMGVAAADYDNDGFVDLYVAGVNRNQLFHNNGDGTFTDLTEKAGVSGIHPKFGKTWAISAGWFDYDNDGHLDLLVVSYVNWSPEIEPECRSAGIRAYCSPNSYSGQPNILYHNNGDGTFTDVSDASGIGRHIGKGMAVAFADVDADGFTDAFVSNDTHRNFFFHNNGDGTFRETALRMGVAYNENGKSIAGMGADFRDLDNDGRPDIFVVAMVGDTFPLFLNRGKDFVDITSRSGLARLCAGFTAWSNGIADFDNDGFKDLFTTNSSILDNAEEIERLPSKLPNSIFRNLGDRTFADVSTTAGPTFRVPQSHRGAAIGDLDNDGRLDLVITCLQARPEIFLNRTANRNHWLSVKLVGAKSNRDSLGARVKVTLQGGKALYNHATTSVGLSSSSDKRVHFGLGAETAVESVEVVWASGIRQTLTNPKADQILVIREK